MLLDDNLHDKNVFLIKVGPTKCSLNWSYSNNFYIYIFFFKHVWTFSGSRRPRNRSRGQLLVKNSKATTLQFESDFDFETANAQFKDEIKKETSGMLKGFCQFRLSGCFVHVCVLWIAAVEKVDSGEAKVSQSVPDEENLGDKYYNKAKCFFDNISSDNKPRWGKALLILSNLNRLLMVFSMCIFVFCRRTTWAEEKKLNMETFGVPGRFLRGRGFRGRGRGGQGPAEQRPLPKVGSGRV